MRQLAAIVYSLENFSSSAYSAICILKQSSTSAESFGTSTHACLFLSPGPPSLLPEILQVHLHLCRTSCCFRWMICLESIPRGSIAFWAGWGIAAAFWAQSGIPQQAIVNLNLQALIPLTIVDRLQGHLCKFSPQLHIRNMGEIGKKQEKCHRCIF